MQEPGEFEQLTVIGLGLIGGSLAMAAREQFPLLKIHGIDPNAEALQFGLKHGILNSVSLDLAPPGASTLWPENHLIVLACHLSAEQTHLKALAPQIRGQAITVTDIGSCKQAICGLGAQLLPGQFIGGHPMAGKEFSGIEHATSLLFAGKPYLLTPESDTPPERLEQLQSFVSRLGGKLRLIDPEKHDHYMAYVSHLPQLYAILLAQVLNRNEPGHLLGYHGAGLDDQLRLAGSPYAMWHEIFEQNQSNLHTALLQLRDVIDEVLPLLDNLAEPLPVGADNPWHEYFTEANRIQKQFHTIRANR